MKVIKALPALPRRRPDAHKGDCGRVLIIACSPGLTGAGALAARAASLSGAGLVTLAVPARLNPILEMKLTAEMTLPLPDTAAGTFSAAARRPLARAMDRADAVAIGPGLGPQAAALTRWAAGRARGPLVVDADGLNALAGWSRLVAKRSAPTVLTPHPGEMARLAGIGVAQVQANRRGVAAAGADRYNAVLALKGAGTVVTDGRRLYVNRTGNPGMATGGAGDVLTGAIAALLGQGLEPFAATALAVNVHGLAGDLGAAATGIISLTAEDILAHLPAAWRRREKQGKKTAGKGRK